MRNLILATLVSTVSFCALSSSALATLGDNAPLVGSRAGDASGACRFSGTTSFTPSLKSSSQSFSYVLDGVLSGCTPSGTGAPTDGSVTAGKPGVTIQGVTFDEPLPAGTGGCRDASASGTLWTVWTDGSVTIIEYTTTGVAATLALSGSVVPDKTVTGIDGLQYTIRTTRHGGQVADAVLLTRPDDATACSGDGVKWSALDGPFTIRDGDGGAEPGGDGESGGDGGAGGETPADTTAPVLGSASASPRTFAVDRKGHPELPVTAAVKGTTFKYSLSEAARVVFTIRQAKTGRKVRGKCVKRAKKNRKAEPCKRFVTVGRFAVASVAGGNSRNFSGRIGKRKLSRGRCRAVLVATDASGNKSTPRKVGFRVVRA